MSPHLAYHVTRCRDYPAIYRDGLLARDTCGEQGNYADCVAGTENDGVAAVYCWRNLDDAEGWAASEGWWLHDDLIIIPFDRAGLDVERDPVLGSPSGYWASASRIRGDVAPDRLFQSLEEV